MKKYSVYSLLALGVVALSGCQDEEIVKPVNPAKTGEEITFGSSLYDVENSETRTIYGDLNEEGTAYPVYWEPDGSDEIAIYCPESNNAQLVNYKVTPQDESELYDGVPGDPSKSAAVTKVNPDEAGLQWGSEQTHHFYAFYPASHVTGTENGKIRASIPVTQDPVRWDKTPNTDGGTTYTGVANTDYAFMWAFNSHDKDDGGDVALIFHPWVTILDVEIPGPTEGSVKMSSVQLRSKDETDVINGDFTLDFSDIIANPENPDGQPTYEDAGTVSGTRNQISIELFDHEDNDFITLNPGDKIVVRFYLLPKAYDTGTGEGRNDLQIRVAPFNSSVLTRTLNGQDGTVSGGLMVHKVNKVKLPPVHSGGFNYWMSSLDPNIYVTELSLPGSKMSYQTAAHGASVVYQNLSISDQFKNGIRAFQIQTCGMNDGGSGGLFQEDPDMRLYLTVGGNRTDTRFTTVVKDIADRLAEAGENSLEYAFLLLTYSGSGEGYWSALGGSATTAQAWMEAVRNDLIDMGNDEQYRIYTDPITPETTINDVKGKIIIKVNYNPDDNMGDHLAESDRIPAMFAQWGARDDIETPFTETSAYAINAMRWGTSRNVDSGNLKWFYHEATSVGNEETFEHKRDNIADMWKRSVDYYKKNEGQDMWFLNDLGGCYYGIAGYPAEESTATVLGWTQYVGPYAVDLLQNRDADATLGIVLMNYADPANPYSGNLIQTIINNNFNFILRTDGTPTVQQFNASYSNGGNAIGWD